MNEFVTPLIATIDQFTLLTARRYETARLTVHVLCAVNREYTSPECQKKCRKSVIPPKPLGGSVLGYDNTICGILH
jgi:hypothetical protein